MTEIRWSLAAVDPATRLRCGRLEASDGAAIPYRLWEARGAARALVVFLHGAFDYCGAFDELGPVLAEQGFTTIAYDQRGFGGTKSRGRWRGIDRMVGDVVDVSAALRNRYGRSLPLLLVGESMGATVAVHACARNPGLNVGGLVLAAPGALAGTWRRLLVAGMLKTVRWIAPSGELVCERLSGWDLTPAAAIRLLMDPMILRMVRPNMMFGLAGLARGAVDEAHAVTSPALVMAGTRDDVVRIRCMEQLYCRLGGPKEWAVFEDGPHLLLHWQHNQRVMQQAIGWMERHIAANEDGPKSLEAAHVPDENLSPVRLVVAD